MSGAVTEYGVLYSSGGYLLQNPSPEIEKIYPMAARVADQIRNGGHVYQRRVIVVEDWHEVIDAPAAPASNLRALSASPYQDGCSGTGTEKENES